MLELKPLKSEKIWGYEDWICSTHPSLSQNEFKDFIKKSFPLLVKIIQANDTLSVQVHPDDEKALLLEGKGAVGKTECWLILDAEENARLIYGLKDNINSEDLKKSTESSKIKEYLNSVEVKKGDFVFIPAGTVHAIGKGLRLLEIQQSSDITYRLYDWERGRELNPQKALESIKENKNLPVKNFSEIKNFECDYFNIERIEVKGGWSCIAHFDLLFVIEGNGRAKDFENKCFHELKNEKIFALKDGEKITIEGNAVLLKISAKK